jgi:hypothetical protein
MGSSSCQQKFSIRAHLGRRPIELDGLIDTGAVFSVVGSMYPGAAHFMRIR